MQSKGAIKFIAIALAIVCIYQLSFTWKTHSVENQAREYAKGDSAKERVYLDSMKGENVYNMLIQKYTYAECKEREINLGLDLKGGMNVTLEVSIADLIKAMSNNSPDPTFNKAITNAIEKEKSTQKDFVTLFGEEFQKLDANARLSAIFSNAALQDKVTLNSTNDEVLKIIKKEADDAFESTYKILRTRIDKFGVTQPNIQKLSGSGRILVELPGVKDKERVRKLLQGTAKLEFWETIRMEDMFASLKNANEALRSIITPDSAATSKDTSKVSSNDTTKDEKKLVAGKDTSLKDSNKLSLTQQIAKGDKDTSKKDTSKAAESLADFTKKNPLWAILRQPNVKTQEDEKGWMKSPVMGTVLVKDTAKVSAYLAMPQIKSLFPRECKFLWSIKSKSKQVNALELIAIKIPGREGKAKLEGDAIVDASQDFGQLDHRPEITMNMSPDGANIWRRMTAENKDHCIAIVLDDYVYSFPNVINEIPNGRSSITGNFEVSEAKDLANILKAGKLPAPARIVEEAVVGPSLGQEAINAGLLSFVIALLLVLIYMAFYYSTAGMVADIALFVNIFFIFGVLASLGAVLTLPGIAGMVLTIGMSVDANVLIYERVREEITNGKGMRLAITDGYKMAYSSIIDSNVTTLLIGIILYSFGSGPIQGFATTLVIGICTSLFCAIFITRFIFDWLLMKNKAIKFATKLTEGAFKNINIDFIGKRKYYYIISGTILVGGIISIAVKGFNFGVDFKGGHTYQVKFANEITTANVRDGLTPVFGSAPEVKTFGSNKEVKITTTYLIDDVRPDADSIIEKKLHDGLDAKFAGNSHEIRSSQKVGPTIANDIKVSAIWAIFFSLVVVFFYILIRFKKWQFSLGAVVSLFHDVVIVLSLFSIFNGILPFSLEVDQAFIAAVLTVMGYSITDTVVVFDRLREHLAMHKKQEIGPVLNYALNATLSRTINSSLTIFFVLLSIFLFGGDVIRGFSFALLIGVVVGTYSSICIATPIVLDFDKSQRGLTDL